MIAAITNRPELLTPGQKLAHFRLEEAGMTPLSSSELRRQILEDLSAELAGDVPRIVAFIHGYNTGLESSIELLKHVDKVLTAKLPNAVTVGYLWPSEGCLESYLSDRDHARETAPSLCFAIMEAIKFLEGARCPAELCLVAHSMGNLALAEAARYAWENLGKPATYNAFSEVLMVAPDLDGGAFEPGGEAGPVAVFGRRVTVYSSRKDQALLASSVKRAGMSGARLGRQGADKPAVVPGNVVLIDATATSIHESVAVHSAHFWAERTLEDMRAVLLGTDRREMPQRVEDGPNAWRLTL